MASAKETVTECSVCLDEFQDPHVLPCHHTFCKTCIDMVLTGDRMRCPKCRAYAEKDSIKPDFRIQQFNDALQEALSFHEEESKDLDSDTNLICELCRQNPLAHKCIDCDQWLCGKCKGMHLRTKVAINHKTKPLKQVRGEVMESLMIQLKPLSDNIECCKEAIARYAKNIQEAHSAQADTLAVSDTLRKECISELNAQFDKINATIRAKAQGFVDNLNYHKSCHMKLLDYLKNKTELIKKEIDQDHADIILKHNKLLDEVKHLQQIVRPSHAKIVIPSFQLKKVQSWNPADAISFEYTEGSADQVSVLRSNASREWSCVSRMNLTGSAGGLRVIDRKLWSCQSNNISVYDDSLKLIKHITSSHMGQVKDVAAWGADQLIIAASDGLFVTTKNGAICHTIAPGLHNSVAAWLGKLYTTPDNTGTIDVYEHGETWNRVQQICVPKDVITLYVNNCYIHSCIRSKNKVNVYNLEGQLQHSCDNIPAGEVGSLSMSYGDESGALLVTDYHRKSLLVLTQDKNWLLLHKLRYHSPRAAVFLNDKLFIATDYNKKSELIWFGEAPALVKMARKYGQYLSGK